MMHLKIDDSKFRFLPGLLAIFGMVYLFLATPNGLGLSPDSVAYIHSSKSMLEHGSPGDLSFWPPGYPAMIALFAAFQHDYFLAARLLGVILIGTNLLLFNLILQKCGWGNLISCVFTVLLIFDRDFMFLHLNASSETAFVATLLAGITALLVYSETGSRKMLIGLGLIFAMSAMVRYAGVAFISGATLALFFQSVSAKRDGKFFSNLLPPIQFLAIAAFPISVWVLKKSLESGKVGIHEKVFHPMTPQKWNEGLHTVASWFGNMEIGAALFVGAAILLIFYHKNLSVNAKRLLMISGCLAATYLAFILLTLLYFVFGVQLDYRILYPVKLLVYMSMFTSMQAIVPKWRLPVAGIFSALVLTLNYSDARNIVSNSSLQGYGFAQVGMRDMPILAFIKANHIELDATNSPELTSLYLDQEVKMLPASYTRITGLPFTDQASKIRDLARPRATVVIFSVTLWRDYLPNQQQLMDAGFTNVIYQQPDGVILQHP